MIWLWKCDCGKTVASPLDRVLWGDKRSCGCLAAETKAAQAKAMQKKVLRAEGTNIRRIESAKLQSNNPSGFRGVSWHKGQRAWMVNIGFKGKTYYLGYRDTIEEAAQLRHEAEARIYGEFLDWYYAEHPERKKTI